MGELLPCPKCHGTGKRDIRELAHENVCGLADKMAGRMGGRFKLNELGEARVEQEVERLRARSGEHQSPIPLEGE